LVLKKKERKKMNSRTLESGGASSGFQDHGLCSLKAIADPEERKKCVQSNLSKLGTMSALVKAPWCGACKHVDQFISEHDTKEYLAINGDDLMNDNTNFLPEAIKSKIEAFPSVISCNAEDVKKGNFGSCTVKAGVTDATSAIRK
jgi:hypothetical protein